ncbi:citrate synthase family protein [Paractinoplanes atraurantiacus]|uniref:citrate synthase (unknown stereospecificity) n=1 Tax=Paractinoplanes atraurantiacus TaxID=1036182 RepID=A0A285IFC1_9ACTN|nr:citrate synthase family protein [Actinoplanes atraurantiacus]SNY45641.1 citrate synthase [Actinoplanes atraurantiacus]
MDTLTTEQVAERLGVKPATIYAYVSRGLLRSVRNGDGKVSLFARAEVEAFEAKRKGGGTPGIQTGLTLISDGRLFYRGHDATELAATASFESVANLLWTGTLEHTALAPPLDLLELAVAVTAPLPPAARHTDRLRVIAAAAAAADPLRFDITPAAVVTTGRALLATMVAALPIPPRTAPPPTTRGGGEITQLPARAQDEAAATSAGPHPDLAAELWVRLTGGRGTPADHEVLNAALVLLADHDIAASTLAARVAASTRAHPYAVVGAGLAALDGPLHGAASGLAHELLTDALSRRAPVEAVAARLRAGETIPGFGHRLYPDGDPRAKVLLGLLGDGPAAICAEEIAEAMRDRSGVHPNVDLALAALTLDRGMPPDAGETIFAVARTAGWLAHALEEYGDRPSRFRPSGRYAGRTPA